MRVQCPSCQAILEAPVGSARQVQCPMCSGIMALPDVPASLPMAALVPPEPSYRDRRPLGDDDEAAPPRRRRPKSKTPTREMSWVAPVCIGGLILIAFAAVLVVAFLTSGDKRGQVNAPVRPRPNGADGGQAGAAPGQGQVLAGPQAILIQLNEGEVSGGIGGLNFSVSFTVVRQVPPHEQCFWIIRSSRGTTYEARLMPFDLRENGSLSASSIGAFGEGLSATFTCWIETRRGPAGFADGKRISNEIQMKRGGRGGFPGMPPPPPDFPR